MIIQNTPDTRPARRLMAHHVDVDMRDVGAYIATEGKEPPVLSGSRSSWHYETKGGRRIYHPSAYSRSGWNNMVYVNASFFSVTCGIDWLIHHAGKAARSVAAQLGSQTEKAKGRLARRMIVPPTLEDRLTAFKKRKREEREAAVISALQAMGYTIRRVTHTRYDQSGRFDFSASHPLMPYTSYSSQGVPATVKEVEEGLREVYNKEVTRVEQTRIANLERKIAEREKYELDMNALTPLGRIIFDAEGGFHAN